MSDKRKDHDPDSKLTSNVPDVQATDENVIEEGLEAWTQERLEELDENIRSRQPNTPQRDDWASNAPDLKGNPGDFDLEETQDRLEEHLEDWNQRQDELAAEMPHGEQASNAPDVTGRKGDVSDDVEGYQERIEDRLEEIDEKTRHERRKDNQ